MSPRPTSRIALVTGAAGGLGLETFLSVVCTENLNDVGYFRVSLKSNLQ
jgi:NAD(P)-dependent dehydrogenase (short-subunit alcohol dehydrogenase family)